MNKSENISWMPLFVIAAAAFVGALDATFMNVSIRGCYGIGYDCGCGLDGAGNHIGSIIERCKEAEERRK